MPGIKAHELLPDLEEIRDALGPHVVLEGPSTRPTAQPIGDVLRAAAHDSAFQRYRGTLLGQDGTRPVAVSTLVLVFATASRAAHTFDQVARAAHLRTQVDNSEVAVETATGSNGVVSYWGYVHRGPVLAVLTIDTVDPQHVSISDLRSLVSAMTRRFEAIAPD